MAWVTPKQKLLQLQEQRKRLAWDRLAIRPINSEDHAAYEYMGEVDDQLESVDAQIEELERDMSHASVFPGDYE